MTTGRINQIATRQPFSEALLSHRLESWEMHSFRLGISPSISTTFIFHGCPKHRTFRSLPCTSLPRKGFEKSAFLKASLSPNIAFPISVTLTNGQSPARGHATAAFSMPSMSGRHPRCCYCLSPNNLEVSGEAIQQFSKPLDPQLSPHANRRNREVSTRNTDCAV